MIQGRSEKKKQRSCFFPDLKVQIGAGGEADVCRFVPSDLCSNLRSFLSYLSEKMKLYCSLIKSKVILGKITLVLMLQLHIAFPTPLFEH